MNIVLAACGDIGWRVAQCMYGNLAREAENSPPTPVHFYALRRNPPDPSPAATGLEEHQIAGFLQSLTWVASDLTGTELELQRVRAQLPPRIDAVIATPVPHRLDGYTDYQKGYIGMAEALPQLFQDPGTQLIWVSSTGVYSGLKHATSRPNVIDASTLACPGSEASEALLQAEQIACSSGLLASIIRPAGIYGPGRMGLIRRAQTGPYQTHDAHDNRMTNRIHSVDLAGFIAHLLGLHSGGRRLLPLYLATDGDAQPGSVVVEWIRSELAARGVVLGDRRRKEAGRQTAGLPISNDSLLSSGYRLIYPDFRAGYGSLLDAFATL
ncbi:MAG: hypothetical protein ACR2PW_01600 [Gammaproteobacteria bacterium]